MVDDLGRPLSWLSIPTEVETGAEDAARRMGAAVHEAIREAGLEPKAVARVGLGSPGEMDIPAGMLLSPINLKGWDNFPIRDRVSQHCGLPVTFENDANAAAYGEYWVGSGREFHSMVLLTLGTGIGCGIIIGDLVIQGAHSHGGESGHIIIDLRDDARMCGCGQRGHLEAYASATAVIRRTEEALRDGRPSSLSQRMAAGAELTPKLIADEAEAGDELSLEIIAETARYMAIGMVNMMHTIDPDAVLLGRGHDLRRPRDALGPPLPGPGAGSGAAACAAHPGRRNGDRFRHARRRRRLHRRRRRRAAGVSQARSRVGRANRFLVGLRSLVKRMATGRPYLRLSRFAKPHQHLRDLDPPYHE